MGRKLRRFGSAGRNSWSDYGVAGKFSEQSGAVVGGGGATEGRTPSGVKYGFGGRMGAARWAPPPASPRGMVAGSRAAASPGALRRARSFAGIATVKTALGWPMFPSGTRRKIYFLARGGVVVCRDGSLVARVVELVDTQVSEACAVRCSGSSPLPGTIRGKSALKWLKIARKWGWSSACQCHDGATNACLVYPTRSPATGDEVARESRSRCLEVRAVQFRSCPHSNQLGERRRCKTFQSAAIALAYLLYPLRITQQRPSDSNQVELIAFEPVDKVLQAGRL